MGAWHAGVAAVPVERRGAERTRIECPAQLHLTTGIRFGSLWDLSEGGARVRLDDPPKPGSEILLKWQSHEAFCRVIWIAEGQCGVAFDRPLSKTMLDASLSPPQDETRLSGPVASVGNIAPGKKRSKL